MENGGGRHGGCMVAAGGVWRLWRHGFLLAEPPLADATVERLTDFEGEEFDAAISPDGKFTVFLSDQAGTGGIDAWLSQIGSGGFVTIDEGRPLGYNGVFRYTGFSGDGAQLLTNREEGLGKGLLWLRHRGGHASSLCGTRDESHVVPR